MRADGLTLHQGGSGWTLGTISSPKSSQTPAQTAWGVLGGSLSQGELQHRGDVAQRGWVGCGGLRDLFQP